MFGIGNNELLIILLAVLIFFGAKRIPEVARALGKGLGDFRDAFSGIEHEVRAVTDVVTTREVRPLPGTGALSAASTPAAASEVAEGTAGSVPPDRGGATAPGPEPGPGPGLAG